MQPKVLVTCPVYAGKEYCFPKWIKMVKSLTYPNYDIMVMDNSETDEFYNKYKDQIPMQRKIFDPYLLGYEHGRYRTCESMADIKSIFMAGDYEFWMNIEADVVPPADIIELLLYYGKGADWTYHGYTINGYDVPIEGTGCSLFSRKLISDFDWSNKCYNGVAHDLVLRQFVTGKKEYTTVGLWDITEVEHLK